MRKKEGEEKKEEKKEGATSVGGLLAVAKLAAVYYRLEVVFNLNIISKVDLKSSSTRRVHRGIRTHGCVTLTGSRPWDTGNKMAVTEGGNSRESVEPSSRY